MSLFGTPTTSTTTAAPSFTPFAVPKTMSALTTSGGFSLGTFSFSTPTTTTTSVTSTQGFTLSASGTTAAPTSGSTTTSGPGLGGFTLSGQSADQHPAASGVQKPKDTAVPPELMTLVEGLRKQIKSNKDLSDEIATVSMKDVENFAEEVKQSSKHLATVGSRMGKIVDKADFLKDRTRQDLRQAELVQRRNEALPANQFGYGSAPGAVDLQPIGYLHSLALSYEEQLMMFQEQLTQIERIITSRLRSVEEGPEKPAGSDLEGITAEDMVGHLRRMEETIRLIGARVYGTHDLVEDAKVHFMRYRRSLHGDNVPDPFVESEGKKGVTGQLPKRLEGPDPFSTESHSSLLGMASAMSRNRDMGFLPPTTGLFSQHQSGLFGGGATGGYGTGGQGSWGQGTGFGSFGSGTSSTSGQGSAASMFRPFGSSGLSAATTVPSLGAAFGTASTSAAASTASPFRFSSPFSNASSGTLFGGTATSMGMTKPFGTR